MFRLLLQGLEKGGHLQELGHLFLDVGFCRGQLDLGLDLPDLGIEAVEFVRELLDCRSGMTKFINILHIQHDSQRLTSWLNPTWSCFA